MIKKLLLKSTLSALFIAFFMNAGAVTHIVTVSNFMFSPASFSVNVGDTVQWNWVSGSHTTTSVTIPGSAAPWDSPMTSTTTEFKYKVTEPGNYGYKCTPHGNNGMVGSFTASTVTGIPNVTTQDITTSLFPNPFTNDLFIDLGNEKPEFTQVVISDILGKQIRTINIENLSVVSGNRRIDVADLTKGVYFVTLRGNGGKSKTIRLVKEGA